MLVKFTTHCDIYMPGEIAGFPEEKARALVAARAAVPVETEPCGPDETATAPADDVATLPGSRRRRK